MFVRPSPSLLLGLFFLKSSCGFQGSSFLHVHPTQIRARSAPHTGGRSSSLRAGVPVSGTTGDRSAGAHGTIGPRANGAGTATGITAGDHVQFIPLLSHAHVRRSLRDFPSFRRSDGKSRHASRQLERGAEGSRQRAFSPSRGSGKSLRLTAAKVLTLSRQRELERTPLESRSRFESQLASALRSCAGRSATKGRDLTKRNSEGSSPDPPVAACGTTAGIALTADGGKDLVTLHVVGMPDPNAIVVQTTTGAIGETRGTDIHPVAGTRDASRPIGFVPAPAAARFSRQRELERARTTLANREAWRVQSNHADLERTHADLESAKQRLFY